MEYPKKISDTGERSFPKCIKNFAKTEILKLNIAQLNRIAKFESFCAELELSGLPMN